MDAQSLLDRRRDEDEADENEIIESARSDNPDLPAELLAWAARAMNQDGPAPP